MATPETTLHHVHETERAGLPVFWADGPGPVVAALIFRVGRADEPLTHGGISHLVEHMALFPLGRRPYDYNGRVDESTTAFLASGTVEEVTQFLKDVTASLRDLPFERLETEKRILLTEAQQREVGIIDRLFGLRFGATGFGSLMSEEVGLGWLAAEHVASWAQSRFTLDNAALWMSAEPPEDLELSLPRGELSRPPAPTPCAGLELPAYVQQGTGGVALSVLAERSSDVHAGFIIAQERAQDRLRRDAGLSYSVTGSYLPLGGKITHITAVADCMDREAVAVRQHLVATFDEMAEKGPTPDELAWDRGQIRRVYEDPSAILGTLDSWTRNFLIGGDRTEPRQILRERDALTPESVAQAIGATLDSMLLINPFEAPPPTERFVEHDVTERSAVQGTRHPPTEDARAYGEGSVMFVGADGITITYPPATDIVTVRWDATVLAWPGLSGSAGVVARDGTQIRVLPYRYERGGDLIAAMNTHVPREAWVPLTDRELQLQPVVQRELTANELPHVDREVDALASVLSWDETLVHLAEARDGERVGLFVLTDVRAMFIFLGNEQRFVEKQRSGLTTAAVTGTLRKRLVLGDADGTLELTKVAPSGRLAEIGATLGRL